MMTDLNLILSTTGSSNLSDIPSQSTVMEQSFKWTIEEIARMLQIVVRPILLVIGTVGNFLTFYIMRRSSLKDVSSCFYMSFLALADSSKLTFGFFTTGKTDTSVRSDTNKMPFLRIITI